MKRDFGGTTIYVYSGTVPIAEYAAGAQVTQPNKEYIYAGSQLLATVDASLGTSYQMPDHLSTRVEADANGAVTRTFGHFPFGEVWYETGTASKWKFTSYERGDPGEGALDYADFRFYSSRLGRFMSADLLGGSAGDPESLARYSYVLGDPTNLADPLGLDPGIACLLDSNANCTGFVFPGGGSWNCVLDGFMTPCSLASGVVRSGAADPCPPNVDCLWTQRNPITGALQALYATDRSTTTSTNNGFTIILNLEWHFEWRDLPWEAFMFPSAPWQMSALPPGATVPPPVHFVSSNAPGATHAVVQPPGKPASFDQAKALCTVDAMNANNGQGIATRGRPSGNDANANGTVFQMDTTRGVRTMNPSAQQIAIAGFLAAPSVFIQAAYRACMATFGY